MFAAAVPPSTQVYNDELKNQYHNASGTLLGVLNCFKLGSQAFSYSSKQKEVNPIVDFDEEARKLYQRLNLPIPSKNKDMYTQYDQPDCVWIHPETGAKFYIGNLMTAQNLEVLEKLQIFHIVNC